MAGIAFFGIVMIGLGVLSIFARDFMWQLTKFGNSLEGEKSERSDAWEIKTVFSGILLIVVGIGVILWALD